MKDFGFFRRIWLLIPVLLALAASSAFGGVPLPPTTGSPTNVPVKSVPFELPDIGIGAPKAIEPVKTEVKAEPEKPVGEVAALPPKVEPVPPPSSLSGNAMADAKQELAEMAASAKKEVAEATALARKTLIEAAAMVRKAIGPTGSETIKSDTPSAVEWRPPLVFAEAAAQAPAATYPAGSEIAIVLSQDRFYPAEIHVRSGMATTLVFSSVNRKPAALVIEATQSGRRPASEPVSRDEAPAEITRELGNDRVTAISFEPKIGKYQFHDALGAARGTIIVE